MSTLKCQECGHENETQRVYCHSCGARLDRSSLVDEANKPQKPARRQRNTELSTAIGIFIGNLLKTALFAGILASLIQAARPPANVPTGEKELGGDIIDAPSISVELDEAVSSQRRVGYNEAQLNAFLKNKIKPAKDSPVPAWAAAFDSAFVNLGEGSLRVTKKVLIFSQPLYAGGTYVPVVGSGALAFKPVAGNIGSLPLPGSLFDLVDQYLFGDFAKNLHEEVGAAGKMKAIEVTPKMVVITPGPR